MPEKVESRRDAEAASEAGPVSAPATRDAGTGLEAYAEVVCLVVAEVLETMFFADAAAGECGSHAWMEESPGARIRFAGSHSGEMRLSVSGGAADSIACAFLGLEPEELTEALGAQVLLELTNILCGSILSQLWPQSKLALTPPESCGATPAPASALHQCFELPDGRLAVGIDWREGAHPPQA